MPKRSWKLRFPFLLLLCLVLLVVGAQPGLAGERILSFTSYVVVHPDATMTVTETIKVRAEGREIKRGILRDFPTTYKDRYGNRVRVGFTVQEVLRDGGQEPYKVESVANGQRIRIGKKEEFLRPGVHTYTIVYRTDRQVGFFDKFDELYWNATGTGWTFPIDRAEALIELPPGAEVLQTSAYTGPFGGKGQDYQESRDQRGRVVFTTTRPLGVKEGLTVAVAWPKGLVTEPSREEKLEYFLRDNLSTFAALFGLLMVCSYFLLVWHRVGRDPESGVIIPLFSPPADFSPSGVRYLMRMGYDRKAFATAVVDMAVKGCLRIEESNGDYTLRRVGKDQDRLSPGERRLGYHLFKDGDAIALKNQNHTEINEARKALGESLDREINHVYFNTNRSSFFVGLGLSLLTLAVIALTAPNPEAIFAILWLSVWSVGCCFLAVAVFKRWQIARSGHRFHFGKTFAALATTLFALPFFAGEFIGLGFFTISVSAASTLAFAVLVFSNCLFYYLLKAPTLAGRKIMDQVEGFSLYLSVAEQDRLEVLHPPEKTPELFEKYLPFALALDVENEWSEQFAEVLAQAQVDGRPYAPTWYHGTSWHNLGASGFADSLGSSFAGAISSAATAPGSSSGSGGGGSSGGGGGGGGGSGW